MKNNNITSQTITKVLEKYLTMKNIYSDVVLYIYENPNLSDLKEIIAEARRRTGISSVSIRFIVDGKNKYVYIWNGYCGTHQDAKRLIRIPVDVLKSLYYLEGYATLSLSGDLKVTEIFTTTLQHGKELMQNPKLLDTVFALENWTWVNKYLPNFVDSLMSRKRVLDLHYKK